MAKTTDFFYRKCGDIRSPQRGTTEDPLSAITSGTTYTNRNSCYEITQVLSYNGGNITITFDGEPYSSCLECYGIIYDYVAATDCINQGTYYFEFSGFTGTPLINEVYFINAEDESGNQFYNCYEMVSYGVFNELNPVRYTSIVDTPTLSTTCGECLNSSFLIYKVTSCLGSGIYYVGLSSSDYIGHLISFVDGSGDQRCGTVGLTPIIGTQDGTFISDYGLFVDNGGEVTCDECNAQVAEQRILTNCITNEDEIVWNSLFFNGGESSNLSSSDGCFSVGDIVTGETVTINEFLNFDPQPSCQECIQCNGIQYNYSSCNGTGPIGGFSYSDTTISVLTDGTYYVTGITSGGGQYALFNVYVLSNTIDSIGLPNLGISYSIGDTITLLGSEIGGISPEDDIIITVQNVLNEDSILSFQYLEDTIGKLFYNPITNECCEIISIEVPSSYRFAIPSLSTFDSCLECTGSDNHYVWYGMDCDQKIGGIAVTTGVGFAIGDIVKVKRGDSDFVCVELIDVYNYGVYNVLDSYNSLTTESYSTCDECKGSVRIGISVLSCETNEAAYVNIPLNTWYAVAGYSEVFEGLILSDYDGNCYKVINTCPINAGGGNLDVQHIFTSCSVCYDFYHPIIHANQYYETVVVGYLPGSGYTDGEIVTYNTPHPIWTDGSDTRRTVIQDNAVAMGGFNGLNN